MEGGGAMEKNEFIERLVALRMAKGVSARDMSLSIGQSSSYINNIKSGMSYPSMTGFFYICDYLGITPKEFFDIDSPAPSKIAELTEEAKGLGAKALDHLIAIIKEMKK